MLAAKAKRTGRPRNPPAPKVPESYDRPEYEARLRAITDALEIGDLAEDVRLYMQKILQRADRLRSIDSKRFPDKSTEKVTLLLRTVFESANGAAALTLPILEAVSDCMWSPWVDRGLGWIEAFDQVDLVGLHATLSGLGISDQLRRALHAKLESILGPPTVIAALPTKAVKVNPPPKPPHRISRAQAIERKIEMGLKLLDLKREAPSNRAYGKLRDNVVDVEQALAAEAGRVADRYAGRPEIWRRSTWAALIELSSPSLQPDRRAALEARILAGEEIAADEIRRARRSSRGRPLRERQRRPKAAALPRPSPPQLSQHLESRQSVPAST